jgi:eukaryotic-like serine/threonine-protein kinase
VVGQGGMGTVFKAEHVNMGKTMALKMLAMANPDEDSFRKFRLEAKLASQLSHPNIVNITDFDIDKDRPFIVMDYLKGRSLDRIVETEGILAPDRFVNVMTQACRALGYAHKSGLIHRDVKLSNMMLTERGGEKDVLIIVDFGLVTVLTDENAMRDGPNTSTVGSPYYMSPEQCQGQKIDPRSDIYSLGCVMYRCLTGVVPFPGTNVRETFRMHVLEPPKPFSEVNSSNKIPPQLEKVVIKALSKNPDDRQKDMQQLADEISNATKRRSLLDEITLTGLSYDKSMLNTGQIRKFKGDSSSKRLIGLVLAAVALIFVWLYQTYASKLPSEAPATSAEEQR